MQLQELRPFAVKVVVVITGGVESGIARTDRQLPADSLFVPIEEQYQRRVKHSQHGAMSSDSYAKSVVRQVLARSPPKFVWEGHQSWLIRTLSAILGRDSWFMGFFVRMTLLLSYAYTDMVSQGLLFWRMFELWRLVPEPSKVKLT